MSATQISHRPQLNEHEQLWAIAATWQAIRAGDCPTLVPLNTGLLPAASRPNTATQPTTGHRPIWRRGPQLKAG